jgi:hypothetical protein
MQSESVLQDLNFTRSGLRRLPITTTRRLLTYISEERSTPFQSIHEDAVQIISPKRWSVSLRLHWITHQKTDFFVMPDVPTVYEEFIDLSHKCICPTRSVLSASFRLKNERQIQRCWFDRGASEFLEAVSNPTIQVLPLDCISMLLLCTTEQQCVVLKGPIKTNKEMNCLKISVLSNLFLHI